MLAPPSLDVNSNVPLYRQLFEHYHNCIRTGNLSEGDKLPPTRELAGSLGLNRTTVSAAYALLESAGLISGHVGRGSFVTAAPGRDCRGLDWQAVLDLRFRSQAPLQAAASGTDLISFASSRPSEELFPLDDFRRSCEETMARDDFATVLQLGAPGGYEPLRRYLLESSRRQGVARDHDELCVTSGCQQALDMIQRVLVRPGDKVAIEDPVYPGLKNLFAQSGAQLLGVRIGDEGVELDHLERVLQQERPKLLVLTSNFQNPTGATLPVAARHAVLAAVRRAGTVLVENDIYGELRYKGEQAPALKQLDDTGDTILLRSFSKLTFPGLRVGWVIGPKPLIARLVAAKQLSDLHTDQLSQAVLLQFAESGRLDQHRAQMREAGAQRLAAVLEACERYLPAGTRWTRPQGGMNLWVRLPDPLDADEMVARAQSEGVAYLSGKYFLVSRHEPGGLRLSFAGLAPEKIHTGLRVLGSLFSSELERLRGESASAPAPAIV